MNFRYAGDTPRTASGSLVMVREADISILTFQRSLAVARTLSEMMERIAQGPEDVKKSVRSANEIYEPG
jgi:hypothetical protein